MQKKNIKFLSALAVVATLGTGFATVHAADIASTINTQKPKSFNCNFKRGEPKENLKTKLDALVTAGTITQAQEDAALNLITPKKVGVKGDKGTFFKTKLDTLVSAGTINQTQEDAVLKIFTVKEDGTKVPGKRYGKNFKTELNALVTAGTITSEQETAITNLLKPNKGTQDKDHTSFLKSKLDTLVTAGTITQAQEDAMIKSITTK